MINDRRKVFPLPNTHLRSAAVPGPYYAPAAPTGLATMKRLPVGLLRNPGHGTFFPHRRRGPPFIGPWLSSWWVFRLHHAPNGAHHLPNASCFRRDHVRNRSRRQVAALIPSFSEKLILDGWGRYVPFCWTLGPFLWDSYSPFIIVLQCFAAGMIGGGLGRFRTEEMARGLSTWTLAVEGQEPPEWVLITLDHALLHTHFIECSPSSRTSLYKKGALKTVVVVLVWHTSSISNEQYGLSFWHKACHKTQCWTVSRAIKVSSMIPAVDLDQT